MGLGVEPDLQFDLVDMATALANLNPARMINELVYINPTFSLNSVMSVPPLEVLKAVLRIYTVSDRF
jgi:hypothetical protein